MYAVCIQHELDHLIGKLFLDRMIDFSTLTQMEEFQQYWQKEAASAHLTCPDRRVVVTSLLRVLSYLKPFRLLALVTFVCAGLATALELVPPYLVKIIIDDVIQSKRPELLSSVLGALLGSYVLRNLVSSMRVRFNNMLEQKAVHALRIRCSAHCNACP